MQSEIDGPGETDSLKQYISELHKARVAKLKDKQSQNDDHVLIWRNFGWGTPAKMFFSC